eukprot:gene4962-34742_t
MIPSTAQASCPVTCPLFENARSKYHDGFGEARGAVQPKKSGTQAEMSSQALKTSQAPDVLQKKPQADIPVVFMGNTETKWVPQSDLVPWLEGISRGLGQERKNAALDDAFVQECTVVTQFRAHTHSYRLVDTPTSDAQPCKLDANCRISPGKDSATLFAHPLPPKIFAFAKNSSQPGLPICKGSVGSKATGGVSSTPTKQINTDMMQIRSIFENSPGSANVGSVFFSPISFGHSNDALRSPTSIVEFQRMQKALWLSSPSEDTAGAGDRTPAQIVGPSGETSITRGISLANWQVEQQGVRDGHKQGLEVVKATAATAVEQIHSKAVDPTMTKDDEMKGRAESCCGAASISGRQTGACSEPASSSDPSRGAGVKDAPKREIGAKRKSRISKDPNDPGRIEMLLNMEKLREIKRVKSLAREAATLSSVKAKLDQELLGNTDKIPPPKEIKQEQGVNRTLPRIQWPVKRKQTAPSQAPTKEEKIGAQNLPLLPPSARLLPLPSTQVQSLVPPQAQPHPGAQAQSTLSVHTQSPGDQAKAGRQGGVWGRQAGTDQAEGEQKQEPGAPKEHAAIVPPAPKCTKQTYESDREPRTPFPASDLRTHDSQPAKEATHSSKPACPVPLEPGAPLQENDPKSTRAHAVKMPRDPQSAKITQNAKPDKTESNIFRPNGLSLRHVSEIGTKMRVCEDIQQVALSSEPICSRPGVMYPSGGAAGAHVACSAGPESSQCVKPSIWTEKVGVSGLDAMEPSGATAGPHVACSAGPATSQCVNPPTWMEKVGLKGRDASVEALACGAGTAASQYVSPSTLVEKDASLHASFGVRGLDAREDSIQPCKRQGSLCGRRGRGTRGRGRGRAHESRRIGLDMSGPPDPPRHWNSLDERGSDGGALILDRGQSTWTKAVSGGPRERYTVLNLDQPQRYNPADPRPNRTGPGPDAVPLRNNMAVSTPDLSPFGQSMTPRGPNVGIPSQRTLAMGSATQITGPGPDAVPLRSNMTASRPDLSPFGQSMTPRGPDVGFPSLRTLAMGSATQITGPGPDAVPLRSNMTASRPDLSPFGQSMTPRGPDVRLPSLRTLAMGSPTQATGAMLTPSGPDSGVPGQRGLALGPATQTTGAPGLDAASLGAAGPGAGLDAAGQGANSLGAMLAGAGSGAGESGPTNMTMEAMLVAIQALHKSMCLMQQHPGHVHALKSDPDGKQLCTILQATARACLQMLDS